MFGYVIILLSFGGLYFGLWMIQKAKLEDANLYILGLKIKIDELKIENDYLQRRLTYQNIGGNASTRRPTPRYSQDLKDAVKKGMAAAHPDKGGNAEDFIRFRKVYEEINGKGVTH